MCEGAGEFGGADDFDVGVEPGDGGGEAGPGPGPEGEPAAVGPVGATLIEKYGPSPWAPGFGMLTDRFGVTWILDVAAPYAG